MFAKIFSSIFDGTLATVGPWEAIVTFENILILADKDGIVDMTPEALSRRTTIPLEIILKGIAALELPDLQSRTPDEDGRRIVRLSDARPWGWRIVNYLQYRNIRNAEDRREYMKNYQREYRKQGKPNKHSVNNCKQNKPMHYASASSLNSLKEDFETFYASYPRRVGKDPARRAWEKLNPDEALIEHIMGALEAQKLSHAWQNEPKKFIPHPATWINNKRWEDEIISCEKAEFNWKKHV